MSVYVGPLKNNHLNKRLPRSAHLMAESDDELEQFARIIGLRKDWKHNDHYDISPNKRLLAIQHGAMERSDLFLCGLRFPRKIK